MIDKLLDMHRRWELWAADDGTEPLGGGVNVGDAGDVETVYVTSPEEIPSEEPAVDVEELQRQNAEFAARMEALEQQANAVTAMKDGISALGDKLGPQQKAEAARAGITQAPGESEEAFAARINEKLYDDPYKNLTDFTNRKMQPLVAQMINNNVVAGRRWLELDPEKSANFKRYRAEVDAEMEAIPPMEKLQDPMVYEKAYQRVIARHVDDIVEERVAAALAQSAGAPANGGVAQSVGGGYVENTTYRKPEAARKQYRVLTDAERRAARAQGVSDEVYWDYLKSRGLK